MSHSSIVKMNKRVKRTRFILAQQRKKERLQELSSLVDRFRQKPVEKTDLSPKSSHSIQKLTWSDSFKNWLMDLYNWFLGLFSKKH